MADKAIEVLLDEKRNFQPPKELKKSANVNGASIYNNARKDPQAFWAKAAKELLKESGPGGSKDGREK